MNIGIYSGTFDPPHMGHLAFARDALGQCKLDKVYFLIEPQPRRKQGVKAFEHRVRMMQLAVADEPAFGLVVLEQQRFTPAETLPALVERFSGAQLHLLMGDDILNHFADSDWPDVEILINTIDFAVGVRNHTKEWVDAQLEALCQARGFIMRYHTFQASKPEFSSASIKHALKRGKPAAGLPLAVSEYIDTTGLYRPKAS